MADLITGNMIRQALTESEWHRRQIQGFCYKIDPDLERHVAKDLTKKIGEQTIFEETADPIIYNSAHDRMMSAIEDYQNAILADYLNRIMKGADNG